MLIGQPEGFLVVLGAHDAHHRTEDLVGVDRHIGGDVIEQGRPDEVATFQARVAEGHFVAAFFATVDDEFGAGGDAGVNVATHSVQRGFRDQWAVVGFRVQAVADPQMFDPLGEPVAQPVRGFFPDRYRDADCHAPFPGAAVAGTDEGVDGLIQVGVRHHDHVVFSATEALGALAGCRRTRVDVLRDVGRADKSVGLDVGVVEQGVDGLLVALDDLEGAWWEAGLEE